MLNSPHSHLGNYKKTLFPLKGRAKFAFDVSSSPPAGLLYQAHQTSARKRAGKHLLSNDDGFDIKEAIEVNAHDVLVK
jgi:hypothetical protein